MMHHDKPGSGPKKLLVYPRLETPSRIPSSGFEREPRASRKATATCAGNLRALGAYPPHSARTVTQYRNVSLHKAAPLCNCLHKFHFLLLLRCVFEGTIHQLMYMATFGDRRFGHRAGTEIKGPLNRHRQDPTS